MAAEAGATAAPVGATGVVSPVEEGASSVRETGNVPIRKQNISVILSGGQYIFVSIHGIDASEEKTGVSTSFLFLFATLLSLFALGRVKI